MSRNISLFLAAAAVAVASPVYADEASHRSAGAHVHGQGTLNLAIDGGKIAFELEAPGADIVGFEHAASTDAQKAQLDKAKTTLGDVLSLFKFPAAAGCTVDKTDVDFVTKQHDHHHDGDAAKANGGTAEAGHAHDDHDHDHKDEAKAGSGHDGHDHGGKHASAEHAEFHATYALTCAAPEKLTGFETQYFATFAKAQALNVNVTTAKGQTQSQLTREKTTLDLGGVI